MRERTESPVAPTDVLYVDSDEDFAALVERSLTRLDPTVSVEYAKSSEAAFEKIENGIDCVVSAYTLRDTDAVSFLETFRKEYPDLPFVLFTGAGSESVAADAIAAGVSAYVPVRAGENNFELLAQRIWTVTQGYRAKQRAEATAEELRKAYQRTPEGVVAVGADWRIIFTNDRFAEQHEIEAETIAGQVLWQVVPDFAGTQLESTARTVIETDESQRATVALSDGRRLAVRIFPDEDGGVIFYTEDVTDEWHGQRRREYLSAVANGLETPALVVGRDVSVQFANDAATDQLGIDSASLSDVTEGTDSASADEDRLSSDGDPLSGGDHLSERDHLSNDGDPPSVDGNHLSVAFDPADAERVETAIRATLEKMRRDSGVRSAVHNEDDRPGDDGLTTGDEPEEDSFVVDGVTVERDVVADLRIEPFTVDEEPHALVVVEQTAGQEPAREDSTAATDRL
jgi:CheY-like chemotaxis protein